MNRLIIYIATIAVHVLMLTSCDKELSGNYSPGMPLPENPTLSDGAEAVGLLPRITWSSYDPEGAALTFTLYLDTNEEPQTKVVEGTKDYFYQIEESLEWGTTYYWKVEAVDALGAIAMSDVYSFTTAQNVPPTASVLTQPANDPNGELEKLNVSVDFSWEASVDEVNGRGVTYDLFLKYQTAGAEEGTNEWVLSQENIQGTTCTASVKRGKKYSWKVVAKTELGTFQESDVFNFFTIDNQLPAQVSEAIYPVQEMVNSDLSPIFSWGAVTDPDNESLTYSLYLGQSEDNLELLAEGISENTYTMTGDPLVKSTEYFWKVVAMDASDGTSTSQVFSFTTAASDPASKPEYIAPADAMTDVDYTANIRLEWNPSVDPNGDAVTYEIYLGENADAMELLAENVTTSFYEIPANTLTYTTTYYWKVVAVEANDVTTRGDVWSFTSMQRVGPGSFETPYTGDDTALAVAGDWLEHMGLKYLVVETANGDLWLDRNLGAEEPDQAGWYFQGCRKADGHQLANSETTPDKVSNHEDAGHALFVTPTTGINHWTVVADAPKDAWTIEGDGGANNPSPKGFRLPSAAEITASLSELAIAGSGKRNNKGSIVSTATPMIWLGEKETTVKHKVLEGTAVKSMYRAYAYPVRCIKIK